MSPEARLELIRRIHQTRDEGLVLSPSDADLAEEISLFNARHEEARDEITAACMDAVFEGGQ